ncbi:hypothetical protein L1049_014415 [Liquidambar formosana]|uniref:LOB domain-containing protein n=1 Tax=Liquidambar formosana TaxID=63359 RepID=A0AAP0WV92_LIQFO
MESSNMGSQAPAKTRIHQPCAGCRMLRRRCDSNCVLAPYFPCDKIENFAGVHRVFGASNVVKMIQMVEETRREDAVKALVYEATARLRDPVYGSTGAIFNLQKMVQELTMQVEAIRAQVLASQEQRDQLLGIVMNVHQLNPVSRTDDHQVFNGGDFLFNDDTILGYDPVIFPPDCEWIS